jgi:uncharacterized NAD-dependent epimerase/dehydratase family protein
MNLLTVTNVAQQLNKTPFEPGFEAVFVNNSGAAATLQGSDDGVTYSALANAVATGTMTQVTLKKYLKLAAAGNNCYLLI